MALEFQLIHPNGPKDVCCGCNNI